VQQVRIQDIMRYTYIQVHEVCTILLAIFLHREEKEWGYIHSLSIPFYMLEAISVCYTISSLLYNRDSECEVHSLALKLDL